MLARILTVALLALPRLALDAQSSIPPFLLVTKEKVRAGKMVVYDTNESRIAATCARMRCPHGYVALRSSQRADKVLVAERVRVRRREDCRGREMAGPSIYEAAQTARRAKRQFASGAQDNASSTHRGSVARTAMVDRRHALSARGRRW